MNSDSLVSRLHVWAATLPCLITTDVLAEPPPFFVLPGQTAGTSRGVMLGVYPAVAPAPDWLGVWVPETGDGSWMTVTAGNTAEFELRRLAFCPAPADVVAEVDRLTREFTAALTDSVALAG